MWKIPAQCKGDSILMWIPLKAVKTDEPVETIPPWSARVSSPVRWRKTRQKRGFRWWRWCLQAPEGRNQSMVEHFISDQTDFFLEITNTSHGYIGGTCPVVVLTNKHRPRFTRVVKCREFYQDFTQASALSIGHLRPCPLFLEIFINSSFLLREILEKMNQFSFSTSEKVREVLLYFNHTFSILMPNETENFLFFHRKAWSSSNRAVGRR